jgi:hypothetical protein
MWQFSCINHLVSFILQEVTTLTGQALQVLLRPLNRVRHEVDLRANLQIGPDAPESTEKPWADLLPPARPKGL